MTILKTLTNTAEVIFYYLILFVITLVNVFIPVSMGSRSTKASNREQRSGNQGMAMGSVN